MALITELCDADHEFENCGETKVMTAVSSRLE